MEYKIITENRPDWLEREVMKSLSDGWRLQGGVCMLQNVNRESPSGWYLYAQAMVKGGE